MSFYRTVIAAVTALGLATSVFAADENMTQPANEAAQTAQAQTSASDSAATEQTKVNINTATAKELMKVKGLNAAKAKAIIAHRKKHGDFKSLDELKEVKGFKKMNEKTMQNLQDQLSVN